MSRTVVVGDLTWNTCCHQHPDKCRCITYQYVVDDEDDWPYEVRTRHTDPAYIAEEAAQDFHSDHDGWEADWPLTIAVMKDGEVLGKFTVEREAVPEFQAYEIKEKP
jgi:hypothetical protein